MKYPRCRSTRWFTLIFFTSRSIVRNKRTAVLSLLLPWPLSNVIFIPNARCNRWYGISQDTDGLNESFLISLTTADMTLSRCIKEMRIKKNGKTKEMHLFMLYQVLLSDNASLNGTLGNIFNSNIQKQFLKYNKHLNIITSGTFVPPIWLKNLWHCLIVFIQLKI